MSGTPRNISPGFPPLLWSNVEEAFQDINQNFNELYATIQADGSTQVVNFAALYDDVAPAVDNTYTLGRESFRWKEVYVAGYADNDSDENNGVWLNNAQIKGIDNTIDLPLNSTVAGELIIDPNKTFFKSVEIDNSNRIEADEFIDTLNLISGTAIQLSTDSAAESITIDNIGVTSLLSGSGISVSSATGAVTVGNTGVLSVTNSSTLPAGRTVGAGIAVNNGTGNITLTNTGILSVEGGFGITVNIDTATGIANVVNTAPAQAAFQRIRLSGDTLGFNDVIADTTNDILTLVGGTGITVTTDTINDSITFSFNQETDITGSVFANDSTLLIDSVDGIILAQYLQGTATIDVVGNTTGYHTGDVKGSVFGDDSTKLVDSVESKIVGIVENASVSTDTVITNNLSVNGIARIGNHWPFSNGSDDIGRVGNTYRNIYATTLIGNVQGNVSGDVNGSIFADNSTRLIDGTEGVIHAEYLQGTAQIDIKGSVFGDDSTVIIDGATSTVTGKIAPNGTTPGSEFAAGESGEIRVDDDYIWVKTPTTGAWKKVALTSFGS